MEVKLINAEEIAESFYTNWGEFATVCYNTPKEKATGVGKHCMKSGHYSGSRCEHFKFEISGISRACSMQLNRHEIGVVKNQQSQRYVDMASVEFVIPPAIAKNEAAKEVFLQMIEHSKEAYTSIQELLIEDGRDREQANEDARYVLLESAETCGTYGFTLEALENLCHKRLCLRSQWEIRKLVALMKKAVLEALPELADKLVPSCDALLWCPEGRACCGRRPTKEALIEDMKKSKK